jgi:hypothetical protein
MFTRTDGWPKRATIPSLSFKILVEKKLTNLAKAIPELHI